MAEADPKKRYRIKVKNSIEVAPGVWARPHDDVVVTGDVVNANGDKIESHEEVE